VNGYAGKEKNLCAKKALPRGGGAFFGGARQ
jgi:hypothetical protein